MKHVFQLNLMSLMNYRRRHLLQELKWMHRHLGGLLITKKKKQKHMKYCCDSLQEIFPDSEYVCVQVKMNCIYLRSCSTTLPPFSPLAPPFRTLTKNKTPPSLRLFLLLRFPFLLLDVCQRCITATL